MAALEIRKDRTLCSGAGDRPRYTARSTITPEPLAKLQRV